MRKNCFKFKFSWKPKSKKNFAPLLQLQKGPISGKIGLSTLAVAALQEERIFEETASLLEVWLHSGKYLDKNNIEFYSKINVVL